MKLRKTAAGLAAVMMLTAVITGCADKAEETKAAHRVQMFRKVR